MELVAQAPSTDALSRRVRTRLDPPALGAWTLAFALVFYLALRDGGYDAIVRSEVGVAIWWVILLAALAGILPARIGAAGWVAIGLLGAFALWTGLAIGWSQSAESSLLELAREATYLGFFVLAVALQGRAAARHTINGLACAIGLVTALAVLSRLHPQWFAANAQIRFLGAGAGRRLSYPLNYWNALAAFAAMGVPLLLALAIGARTVLARAVSAAVLPLSALCVYLTVSRGGVLELGVALLVFLLLVRRRVEALGTMIAAGAGGAILILAASRRPPVRSGLDTAAAVHQGGVLLALALVVCAGVALLQVSMALAARHVERPQALRPGRRVRAAAALALVACAVVVALAAGAPGKLANQWNQFKQPPGVVVPVSESTVFSRLSAINGNGRYQFWVSAVHAEETNPWVGIGPGTFRFWWAAHATTDGPVLNAHSLYFETLGETGIVGLALIVGLLVWLMGVAVWRSLREPGPMRLWIAAAAAGLAGFMAAAAIDWVWQMAAIVAAALLLGAVIVSGQPRPAALPVADTRLRLQRAAVVLLSLCALGAIAVPLADAIALRRSQAAADAGQLAAAYRDSLTAQRIEPYAATPRLQEALVLEAAGELGPAARAALAATRDQPTNWQTWLTLARIDAERGAYRPAINALDRARSLDPRSNLFRQP
jgi:hypothetical protein